MAYTYLQGAKMMVFKDHQNFLRLPTYFLVIVILVLPLAHTMPTPSQRTDHDQEDQRPEPEKRLFKRGVSTIIAYPDFQKLPEALHMTKEVPEIPDISEPQVTQPEVQNIKSQETTSVSLLNRLLATKLAIGAKLANVVKHVLSGKSAIIMKFANATRAASRIKLTLATIIQSSKPNFHLIGSEEALNGDDETFWKWVEGEEVNKIWSNKNYKTLVSMLESAIAVKIRLGGTLMDGIKNELQGKASLTEKFAWASKVASRAKLIWALQVGSELGLKDDMPLPKYDTLSDDDKWKKYIEELGKFAESHGVDWDRIVLG